MNDLGVYRTNDLIGRRISNGFGKKEIVSLPQKYWNYYDWCVAQGWDMDEWGMYYDLHRKQDATFSDVIYFNLWRLLCSRYKQGLSCPPNSPPDFYEDFLQEIETGKYREIFTNDVSDKNDRDEIMHRPFLNSKEVSEIIALPRKYWLHLEYLYIRGKDTKSWIKELDSKRIDCKIPDQNLTDYLKNALIQSENEHFHTDEDMPLYINPEGYPE